MAYAITTKELLKHLTTYFKVFLQASSSSYGAKMRQIRFEIHFFAELYITNTETYTVLKFCFCCFFDVENYHNYYLIIVRDQH